MTRADQIVALLKARGGATFPEIYKALGIRPGNASRVVADMLTRRLIVRKGEKRKTVYTLAHQGVAARRAASIFDTGKETE